MMEAPFNMEEKLWKAIIAKNRNLEEEYITDYTTAVFNGKRYQGEHFIDEIDTLNITAHTVDNVEVVFHEGNLFQIVYSTKIYSSDEKITGDYYVASTWMESYDSADIIFTMINKI